MPEPIEVIETRIVPVDKPGMLTIEAPNGLIVQAPFAIWIAALLGQMTESQQSQLCDHVARLALENNLKHPRIDVTTPGWTLTR